MLIWKSSKEKRKRKTIDKRTEILAHFIVLKYGIAVWEKLQSNANLNSLKNCSSTYQLISLVNYVILFFGIIGMEAYLFDPLLKFLSDANIKTN